MIGKVEKKKKQEKRCKGNWRKRDRFFSVSPRVYHISNTMKDRYCHKKIGEFNNGEKKVESGGIGREDKKEGHCMKYNTR